MTQAGEVPRATWQKSSYSTDADGTNCLELTLRGADVLLRESAEPAATARLSGRPLGALLRRIKAGPLDTRGHP